MLFQSVVITIHSRLSFLATLDIPIYRHDDKVQIRNFACQFQVTELNGRKASMLVSSWYHCQCHPSCTTMWSWTHHWLSSIWTTLQPHFKRKKSLHPKMLTSHQKITAFTGKKQVWSLHALHMFAFLDQANIPDTNRWPFGEDIPISSSYSIFKIFNRSIVGLQIDNFFSQYIGALLWSIFGSQRYKPYTKQEERYWSIPNIF